MSWLNINLCIQYFAFVLLRPLGFPLYASSIQRFPDFCQKPNSDLTSNLSLSNPSILPIDFSEFTRAEGTLIDNTIQEMQGAITRYGIDNVFIVTARAEDEPVFNFLESFGLVVPQVVATEGSAGKAPWLSRTLILGNYDKVIVYEDCRKNIKMLKDVRDSKDEQSQ